MAGPDPTPRPHLDPRRYRTLFVWLLVILAVVTVLSFREPPGGGATKEIDYSELKRLLARGKVESFQATVQDEICRIEGAFARTEGTGLDEPKGFVTSGPKEDLSRLLALADAQNPPVPYKTPPKSRALELLLGAVPWILFFVLIYFLFFRQFKGMGGGGVLSFGKSRATRITRDKLKKTFEDVAGIDEAKEEVYEIIEYLRNPDRFRALGGRMPRGCLLIGPPGTGKTLLAKAIAGEADVPFFSISGSDFVEMFVGVGASRVRDLFEQAKTNSPCIIFLDEIDAVGRKRGTGYTGGHDEREQTLNAILVEMDGFSTDENVIVMAATNRPDVLDNALLRPGRFDRRIYVDLPDLKGREAILKVHARNVVMGKGADLLRLARGTPGFSGADLESVINEAAILAAIKNKKSVESADLEEARDKVLWGKEKRSRIMTEEDRRVTAFHEAGHALANQLVPGVSPLHKVTIIQRGRALGATMQLPEKDEYTIARKRVLGEIKLLLAGHVAEELLCGDITSGNSNDLQRATHLARSMACEWGMTKALGLVHYGRRHAPAALGHEFESDETIAEATQERIDAEIRRLVDEAYAEIRRVVEQHLDQVKAIAAALLEFEVLTGDEVKEIMETGSADALRARRRLVPSEEPRAAKSDGTEARGAETDAEESDPFDARGAEAGG